MFQQVDPTGGLSQQAIPAFTQNNDRAAQMANAGADRAQRGREGAADRKQRGEQFDKNAAFQQQDLELQKQKQAHDIESEDLDRKLTLTLAKHKAEMDNNWLKYNQAARTSSLDSIGKNGYAERAIEKRKEISNLQTKRSVLELWKSTSSKEMNPANSINGRPSEAFSIISKAVNARVGAKAGAANAALARLQDAAASGRFGKKKSNREDMMVDPNNPGLVHILNDPSYRFEKGPDDKWRVKGKKGVGPLEHDVESEVGSTSAADVLRGKLYTTVPVGNLDAESASAIEDDMGPLGEVIGSYLTTQGVEKAADQTHINNLVKGLLLVEKGGRENLEAGQGLLNGVVAELAKSKDEKGKEIGPQLIRESIGESLAIAKSFLSQDKPLAKATMHQMNLDSLQSGESPENFIKLETDNTGSAKTFTNRLALNDRIGRIADAAGHLIDTDTMTPLFDSYHNGTYQLGGSIMSGIPHVDVYVQTMQHLANSPDLVDFAEKVTSGDPNAFEGTPFQAEIAKMDPKEREFVHQATLTILSKTMNESQIHKGDFDGLHDDGAFIDRIARSQGELEALGNERELNAQHSLPPMPLEDASWTDDFLNELGKHK